jgi:hypothetical protein
MVVRSKAPTASRQVQPISNFVATTLLVSRQRSASMRFSTPVCSNRNRSYFFPMNDIKTSAFRCTSAISFAFRTHHSCACCAPCCFSMLFLHEPPEPSLNNVTYPVLRVTMGHETQSSRHEPVPATQPARSALSRSQSARWSEDNKNHASDLNSLVQQYRAEASTGKSYLPKGLTRPPAQGSLLIMPTRPYGDNGAMNTGDNIESPQWGWYINTTPPTPEMYRSSGPRKSDVPYAPSMPSIPSHTHSSSSSSGPSPSSLPDPRAAPCQPNHVFQNLQDKRKHAAHVGWPTIPL